MGRSILRARKACIQLPAEKRVIEVEDSPVALSVGLFNNDRSLGSGIDRVASTSNVPRKAVEVVVGHLTAPRCIGPFDSEAADHADAMVRGSKCQPIITSIFKLMTPLPVFGTTQRGRSSSYRPE